MPSPRVPRMIAILGILALSGTAALAQAGRLGNEDVIKMAKAGLSAAVISQAIDSAANVSFETTPDALIQLKSAGVPDSVISIMIKRAAQAPQTSPQNSATGAAAGGGVEIPDGFQIPLRIVSSLSSATSKVGDPVRFAVMEDVKVGNAIVIDRNATATGKVTEAKKSGSFGRGGSLKFVVDSVTAADGTPLKVRFSRDFKGAGNAGGAIDAAAGAATGSTSRVINSAKGQVLAKGTDISVKPGTQYDVFTDGMYHVTPPPPSARRR